MCELVPIVMLLVACHQVKCLHQISTHRRLPKISPTPPPPPSAHNEAKVHTVKWAFLVGQNSRGTTIYCIREIVRELNFWGKRNQFIDINQVRSKLAIVYNGDSRKEELYSITVMDALVGGHVGKYRKWKWTGSHKIKVQTTVG